MNISGFALVACEAAIELDNLRLKQHEGLLVNTQAVHDWIMKNVVNDLDGLRTGVLITHNAALETSLVDQTMTDVNDFRPVMAARCHEMAALINAPTKASEDTVKTLGDWCLALSKAASVYEAEWNRPHRRYFCAA